MRTILVLGVILSLSLSGCMAMAPNSFRSSLEPGWSSIELRDGVNYETAWKTVFNLLVRRFDVAMVVKEDGYLRTDWLDTWSGPSSGNYAVRVTVKFSNDRKVVQIKSEARHRTAGTWYAGTDVQLASTLKIDLMGTIGRLAR